MATTLPASLQVVRKALLFEHGLHVPLTEDDDAVFVDDGWLRWGSLGAVADDIPTIRRGRINGRSQPLQPGEPIPEMGARRPERREP